MYGSTDHEIELLRSYTDGLLKIANTANMLPKCNENPRLIEESDVQGVEVGIESCHGAGRSNGFAGGKGIPIIQQFIFGR